MIAAIAFTGTEIQCGRCRNSLSENRLRIAAGFSDYSEPDGGMSSAFYSRNRECNGRSEQSCYAGGWLSETRGTGRETKAVYERVW